MHAYRGITPTYDACNIGPWVHVLSGHRNRGGGTLISRHILDREGEEVRGRGGSVEVQLLLLVLVLHIISQIKR